MHLQMRAEGLREQYPGAEETGWALNGQWEGDPSSETVRDIKGRNYLFLLICISFLCFGEACMNSNRLALRIGLRTIAGNRRAPMALK